MSVNYAFSLLVLAAVLAGQTLALGNPHLLHAHSFHLIMHIAGGFGIGLLFYALSGSMSWNVRHRRIAVIGGAVLLGILWEVFEAYFNLTGFKVGTMPYYADALKDLANDIVGGAIALIVFARK